MRRALLGSLLLLAAVSATVAHASELVVLTAGVVKAVDQATGVVLLDSGLKLRVRSVIINDQVSNVAAIRVDDTIFVSGVEVNTADDSRARARADGR